MKRLALFLFLATGTLFAQLNPPKYSAYVNPGTGWAPWGAAAAGGGISQPPSIALYCKASASAPWTPCTGANGSATPSGPAGGDLAGTYPNPTVVTSHITSGTAAFTGTVSTTGNINVQGNVSSAANTTPASPTNSGVLLVATPNIANLQMFDATRTVNNRTAEWIFFSGAAALRFANDAHSAVLNPFTVFGGQAGGITGIASNSGSGAWQHTGLFLATGTVTASSFNTTGTVATNAIASGIRAVTVATDTATVTDHTILCNASANPVAEQLPSAPTRGQMVIFKKIDSTVANSCTLQGNGLQIDGQASAPPITAQFALVRVQFDGTTWWTW